jgi:hypothetical protein
VSTKIEILKVKLIEPRDNGLVAFADLRVNDVVIRDFRIFKQNGKPFVQTPYTTMKKGGRLHFHSIVDFPEELKVEINARLITAFFGEVERANDNSIR